MNKIIVGFKSKKQILEVMNILRKNGRQYAYHKEITYKELYKKAINELCEAGAGINNLSVWLTNRADNGKKVFSFGTHTYELSNTVTAQDFILQSKSANCIILEALQEDFITPKSYLKKQLRFKKRSSLYNSIMELRQMGVIIKEFENVYCLISTPDTIKLTKTKVYSGLWKEKHAELKAKHIDNEKFWDDAEKSLGICKDLSKSGLIDSDKLAQTIMDKVGFDNTEKTFRQAIGLIAEYWLDKMKRFFN